MDNPRRASRNIKTAGFDQRPKSSHHERFVSKDVCKSINIFPIKIQNSNTEIQKQKSFIQTLKNFNSNTTVSNIANKENKRRTLLSIKSKPSLKFDNADQFIALFQNKDEIITEKKINTKIVKKNSFSFTNSYKIDQDSEKIFEMLHKRKEILMLDHSKLIIQATKFKSLLNQFHGQIKEIKVDRDSLSQKVTKYEYYFKQMKLKHVPTGDQEQNTEKNQHLKILNLQKKVQTLNYIIKQYRSNNNQEIKNFQQKLKDFKPNIERQLTQKLAETNQKYERLLKKVQFFEKQCKTNLKLDWQQLMTDFEESKQQNQNNLKVINQLNLKVSQLSKLMSSNDQKLTVFAKIQDELIDHKQKIQKLTDLKFQLQESIEEKDKRIDQLNHLYEQTSFKLQGIKNLQHRIDNKDKTIKKNTIVINRLQCENIELKTKVDTVLGQFQERIFCQKSLQDNLLKANTAINDLTNRLHQNFIDFCENQNNSIEATKQKEYFIGHLFQKVKGSYNQIINEYQNQLKLINTECEKWKETFNLLSRNQQQKFKYIQKVELQLMRIEEKKIRCQDLFNKVSNFALDQQMTKRKPCQSCKHLITYWGQLQNSYNQLKTILQKVMKIQAINQVTSKNLAETIEKQDEKLTSIKSICVLSIPCL